MIGKQAPGSRETNGADNMERHRWGVGTVRRAPKSGEKYVPIQMASYIGIFQQLVT
jgi:hypothetical protein